MPTAKTFVVLPTLWITKRASAPRGAAWAERMNFVFVIVTFTVTYRSGAVVSGVIALRPPACACVATANSAAMTAATPRIRSLMRVL